MDFMIELPVALGKFDPIWVIVDKLTKSAHFYYGRTWFGIYLSLLEGPTTWVGYPFGFEFIFPSSD